MTPNKKKRHHFIAASYLRGFSKDGMLRGLFREPFAVRDVHVKSVAAEKGFYDVRLADGAKSDELEDALAGFDGLTPQIVQAAIAGKTDAVTFNQLRRLYATTLARNHQGRDLLLADARHTELDIVGRLVKEFPDASTENRRYGVEYVMRRTYQVPDHLSPDPVTISRLNVLDLARRLLDLLPSNVCLMRSSAQDFYTSDAPCGSFDERLGPPGDQSYSGPIDWASPTLELTLPLDRRNAILIANRTIPERVNVNFDGVRVINARTAYFTKRVALAYPTEEPNEAALFIAQVTTERTAVGTPLLGAFMK